MSPEIYIQIQTRLFCDRIKLQPTFIPILIAFSTKLRTNKKKTKYHTHFIIWKNISPEESGNQCNLPSFIYSGAQYNFVKKSRRYNNGKAFKSVEDCIIIYAHQTRQRTREKKTVFVNICQSIWIVVHMWRTFFSHVNHKNLFDWLIFVVKIKRLFRFW